MTSDTKAQETLPLREKLSYGCGDFASCLYWQTFMLYLTFYYTDVFRISALATAALLGLSRSVDAFFDPVMGMIGDRTRTRWGKYRPYLFWLCVPFAIAGVLTFTTPGASAASAVGNSFGGLIKGGFRILAAAFSHLGHFFSQLHLSFLANASAGLADNANALRSEVTGRLVWAVLTYNALMLLYTAINIPYTALLGVMTPNPSDRTSLSSIKFVGAFLGGNIIVSFFLLGAVKVLGHGNPARGWQFTFVVIGLAAVALFLNTFWNTRERVEPSKTQKTSILWDLADLVTNVPWLILLATTITFILFVAARSSVTVHYFKYFVGTHRTDFPASLPVIGGPQEWHFESLVSLYNGSGGIASLVGVILLPFYVNRVGKKAAFVSIFVAAIVFTASFYVLKPDQLGLIFLLNLLGSVTGGPLSALIFAMYADTADYSEWKKGRRATGLVMSASIFSQKQGWAIGATVALGLMASVGFQADAVQTPKSLHGLVMLMSVIPAAIGAVSVLLVLFYPLNERRMSQISADLKSRRGGDVASGAATA